MRDVFDGYVLYKKQFHSACSRNVMQSKSNELGRVLPLHGLNTPWSSAIEARDIILAFVILQ